MFDSANLSHQIDKEEFRREEAKLREDLIRRVLFIDPDQLNVAVANGVVTFVGEVGTRNEVRLLSELASRLDGVLRVESELAWRYDDGAE